MKVKVIDLVTALIIAVATTLLLKISLIFTLPLFILLFALFDSTINLLKRTKTKESKRMLFVSICGMACILSLSNLFTGMLYTIVSYLLFCFGIIGLIVSLIFFIPKGDAQ